MWRWVRHVAPRGHSAEGKNERGSNRFSEDQIPVFDDAPSSCRGGNDDCLATVVGKHRCVVAANGTGWFRRLDPARVPIAPLRAARHRAVSSLASGTPSGSCQALADTRAFQPDIGGRFRVAAFRLAFACARSYVVRSRPVHRASVPGDRTSPSASDRFAVESLARCALARTWLSPRGGP